MYDYYQGLSLINEKILGNLDWNKRVTYLQQVEEEYIIRELESNIFAITTLLYIEEYIQTEHRKIYRNAAIKIKYRLIYIYPYLTTIFLADENFIAQADELKERIQRLDKLRKEMMFQEYLIPLTFTTQYELNQFKNFDSEYYSKRKNRFKAIMRAIYIKTCISINYDPKGLDILNKLRDDLLKVISMKLAKKKSPILLRLMPNCRCQKRLTKIDKIDIILKNLLRRERRGKIIN